MERVSPQDLALLFEAHRIRAVDKLVMDLAEVGDLLPQIVEWLGHPLEEITAQEEDTLRAYLVRAQEAKRDGKPTPPPPQRPVTLRGSGQV